MELAEAMKALRTILAVADAPKSDCCRKRTQRLAIVRELAAKALAGVRVEEMPREAGESDGIRS